MSDPKSKDLLEAYKQVHSGNTDEILQEWMPANRLTQWGKKVATGRSDIPGAGLVGWAHKKISPKSHAKMMGTTQVGDEANRMWTQFSGDVLAHTSGGGATGAQIKGWFARTARIPVEQIPALQRTNPDFQENVPYDERAARELFMHVTQQAKELHVSGMVGGGASSYTLTRDQVIQMMIGLTMAQKVLLLRVLIDKGWYVPDRGGPTT
jgi:hypothetical protein